MMHFEILIEDQSGKKALDVLVEKILQGDHTVHIHPYKGIGRIPKGISGTSDPNKRILLDNLPRLLAGYGQAFSNYPVDYQAAVIVVCDLDKRDFSSFMEELRNVLDGCHNPPRTEFCIAIEEGESWFLGDLNAIRKAYPKARELILNRYVNDSICNTWELLADAIYPSGLTGLNASKNNVGALKCEWAEKISPHMDVDNNRSGSFCHFRDTLRTLAGII